MNYVQLVENLRVECGVSGSPLVTVQSLSGELLRLQNWINDAWQMIQLKHQDWYFLRSSFSFVTTAGVQSYTPATVGVPNLDAWNQESVWMYNNALGLADQMPLGRMEWEHFRNMFLRGVQNPMRPITFAVKPEDKSLWFGAIPDQQYTVSGECWTEPATLSADTDTPAMPAKFHKLIVLEAMKKYAGYEAANEIMARAMTEGAPLWTQLEIQQLPQVTVAGALGDHFHDY
ncbi:phage adaptor protein [Paraburkholderia youngii]|uniref:phage adaptor protein n=1 Tax=Paraburkholderia youngii TaxID=2782701 RepID=UPI0015926C85|nr:hypothetical protein [Paraburkholderia youngii]NUX58654.1 hypothetical protein [Paraburkholderia youngii]